MNKYKIDFSRSEYGSMEIEAESQEEAEETFWNNGGWEFNDNGDTDIDEEVPKEKKQIIIDQPISQITPNEGEMLILNQLKDLPQDNVTEEEFKDTCAKRLLACGDNRQDELWRYYKSEVIGQ